VVCNRCLYGYCSSCVSKKCWFVCVCVCVCSYYLFVCLFVMILSASVCCFLQTAFLSVDLIQHGRFTFSTDETTSMGVATMVSTVRFPSTSFFPSNTDTKSFDCDGGRRLRDALYSTRCVEGNSALLIEFPPHKVNQIGLRPIISRVGGIRVIFSSWSQDERDTKE